MLGCRIISAQQVRKTEWVQMREMIVTVAEVGSKLALDIEKSLDMYLL
jgi:hypothetical protein